METTAVGIGFLLHQDNVPAHTVLLVKQFVHKHITVLANSPYLVDCCIAKVLHQAGMGQYFTSATDFFNSQRFTKCC